MVTVEKFKNLQNKTCLPSLRFLLMYPFGAIFLLFHLFFYSGQNPKVHIRTHQKMAGIIYRHITEQFCVLSLDRLWFLGLFSIRKLDEATL